jgi:ribokinase
MTGFMYIIVTPDGDRTILGYRGANAFTDPSELRQDMFYGARALHLSGYALLTEPQRSAALLALDMARRHSLIVALDPGIGGNHGALEDVRGKLPGVDLVLPNLAEAQELTDLNAPEDCAQALVTMGVEVVVVKLGRDGCLINCDGSHLRVPGFTIRTYDSTGAGDSFAAGLLAAHLGGLDWPDAGVLANAMGALTAARVGAGSSTPTAGEVLALLQSSREESNWRPFRKAFDRVLEFLIALRAEKEE